MQNRKQMQINSRCFIFISFSKFIWMQINLKNMINWDYGVYKTCTIKYDDVQKVYIESVIVNNVSLM